MQALRLRLTGPVFLVLKFQNNAALLFHMRVYGAQDALLPVVNNKIFISPKKGCMGCFRQMPHMAPFFRVGSIRPSGTKMNPSVWPSDVLGARATTASLPSTDITEPTAALPDRKSVPVSGRTAAGPSLALLL